MTAKFIFRIGSYIPVFPVLLCEKRQTFLPKVAKFSFNSHSKTRPIGSTRQLSRFSLSKTLTGEFGPEKAVHLALQEALWFILTQRQNLWHDSAELSGKGQICDRKQSLSRLRSKGWQA